jgi:hypothetical protein
VTFYPAPGVAQAVIVGRWNGVIDIRTVWHIEKGNDGLGTPFNATELAQAGNRVIGAFQNFLGSVSNAYIASEVRMRDLEVEDGPAVSVPVANQGGYGGANTGPYEGTVVSWLTGTAGRHNGRTFLPGIAETNVDNNGMIVAGAVADVQAGASNALTFLRAPTGPLHVGVPLNLVILASGLEPPLVERRARHVIGSRVRTEVGIQRRRRISR